MLVRTKNVTTTNVGKHIVRINEQILRELFDVTLKFRLNKIEMSLE